MLDVDIKKTTKDESDPLGGSEYSHPSYGMISVSRATGGSGSLFGSEIKNSNFMQIEISEASVRQDLGRNWYHSTNSIVEVNMSPVQYAELITCPNTSGVPCTITRRHDTGSINYKPIDTVTQHVESVVEEKLSSLKGDCKDVFEKVTEILSQKTIKKADKEEIESLVRRLVADINSNIPFYEESVKESIDKAKVEAKAEIECYVQHAINKAGIKAINDGGFKVLIGDDNDATL